MQQRESKRLQCLYNVDFSNFDCNNHNNDGDGDDTYCKLKMYDSQLNLFLKHLCVIYDCYKTNFGNYLENIRFV